MPEPPGLSPAAAKQASSIGADMKSQGVQMNAGQSQGPQSQEMNAQGGYKVDTPNPTAAPADNRPAAEQVQSAGQTLSNAGVKSEGPALSSEQTSRVDSALANARQSGQDAPSQSPSESPDR